MRRLRANVGSLRTQVVLLILLTLLPVVGLTLYGAAEQRRLAQLTAQQNTQRLLAPAIANYGRLIEETGQLLTVISRLPEVRDRNGPATERLFRD
ncbi:MAG TPA: hypothetical protein VHR86_03685, partial [Armatimonadota bacterium]|nr:hypothetical protein [Armatimonadota bacterium]